MIGGKQWEYYHDLAEVQEMCWPEIVAMLKKGLGVSGWKRLVELDRYSGFNGFLPDTSTQVYLVTDGVTEFQSNVTFSIRIGGGGIIHSFPRSSRLY